MKVYLAGIFLIFQTFLSAQLLGTVQDENGEPLPYTSIYVQHTTQGTSSNLEGNYRLLLEPGKYSLVFQFIGYNTQVKEVIIGSDPVLLDIQMTPETQFLKEFVLTADAEDPAYRVIREAQKKRRFHRDQVRAYSCRVYVKGNQKILDAPTKIMGIEVGDLDGALDSNRQGIVYLSESISELHFKAPDDYKEIIVSSKYSGNDRGYSFNSAREMQFDFYDNSLEMNRQLVSPIADNAMAYYKYELIGTFFDTEKRLVNKIKVIPKRDTDPSFYGTIYIVEDHWNIYALELGATAKATQVYFVDSLTFNQMFVPLPEQDVWRLFNNSIRFKLSGFGFKFQGQFAAVYSDYNVNPNFDRKFFNSTVHLVQDGSNKRDSSYWEAIRPIPLTGEEKIDYRVKDSIRIVREDPAFKDSLDRLNNKFKLNSLISQYNYQNTNKLFYVDITSPLTPVDFNTVQGWNTRMALDIRKYYDEDFVKRILFGGSANYGFSDKRLRAEGYFTYRPTRMHNFQLGIKGGRAIRQINESEPISSLINGLYSLFLKENYAKYYERDFIELNLTTDILPGVTLYPYIQYHHRRALINTSDYSFFKKDAVYTSNDPLQSDNVGLAFEPSQVVKIGFNSRIRFGQKYTVFPNRRFSAGSKGPALNISYQYVAATDDSGVGYQHLSAGLRDSWTLGVTGDFKWYINGGVFFDKGKMDIIDYRHFLGNELLVVNDNFESGSFLMLPFYSFSTNTNYFQAHLEHNFNGFLLDKIPLFNKLGWSVVTGAKYLHTGEHPSYYEAHIGIDRIGIGFLRLLRVDGVWSKRQNDTKVVGIRLQIGM